MTNITIYASGNISINGRSTGWTVLQEKGGTAVYRTVKRPAPVLRYTDDGWVKAEGFADERVRVSMPAPRYALSCNAPASGRPGRSDFERDLLAAMAQHQEEEQ